jgi:polysaccharide pyruvyl transferase WcaK-like protein
MKKVGILTFHDEPNYGAFLQTFALSEAVKNMGYEVEIIDLRIKDKFKYNFIVKLLSPVIWHFIFERARKKHLNRSSQVYYTSEDLIKNPPNCDVYILGSDQVWNKDITADLKYSYFFDFIPDDKPRFAYASSFGMNNWDFNTEETTIVKKLLKKFSGIAVRETSAIDLCKDNCEVDATLVVDPTLLISDYSKLTGTIVQKSNSVVCFKFTKGNEFYEFLNNFKNCYKYDVSVLSKTMPVKGLNNIALPTIKKWIKSIAESEIVITDSYHALIFALINKKQFIVLPANLKNFNRLSELLTDLGLEDRIFYSYDEVLKDNRWKQEIDYKDVDKRLFEKRDSSLAFLKKELNSLSR